jgi:uncharacterized protein with NRDE domain
MCLLVVHFNPQSPQPLWLISHRDEQFKRDSQALHFWPDIPCLAAKDLTAGGTWLAVQGNGRFAAITNRPDLGKPSNARSRGEIVLNYLRSSLSAELFIKQLSQITHHYAGFNLIVGSLAQVQLFSSDASAPQSLPPGTHVISNNPLNEVWGKHTAARLRTQPLSGLETLTPERLLSVLDDRPPNVVTPHAQHPQEYQQQLFILGTEYGTRAVTAAVYSHHQFSVIEQTFGPLGQPLQRTSHTIA